jgi:hypothetical protein
MKYLLSTTYLISRLLVAKDQRVSVYFDRETCEFVGLTPVKINELMQNFPGINIQIELLCIKEWLQTPAGKDRVGTMLFILNWLKRCQAAQPPTPIPECVNPVLQPFVTQYLVEMWQNHQSLLQMNSMSPMVA